MSDLGTSYMGIGLKNPIVAGASMLTCDMDTIKALEEAGAAALVTCSLFEEQIQLERFKLQEDLTAFDNLHPEMTDIFPELEHSGAETHLMWVRRAKESVDIPVIGSLNCANRETWIEYAGQMVETGVDGLELNFYSAPTKLDQSGASIIADQVAIVQEIVDSVPVPVSVKLSPFYANPLNVVMQLQEAGATGFVLFNRFFQPDLDVDKEENAFPFNLSDPGDYGLALRFTGLLYGQVKDLCASTGIWTGKDVAKLVLAGANCVQVVSTLFKNRIAHLGDMLQELEGWMAAKGYGSLADFQGKLSEKNNPDPWAFARAQYARTLLNPDPISRKYKVI
jgi:dihydroorotate dehydrogenase (fumarate)